MYQEFNYLPCWTEGRLDFICTPDYSYHPDAEEGKKVVKAKSQSKAIYDKRNSATQWAARIQTDYVRIVLDYAYMRDADKELMGEITTESTVNLTYAFDPTKDTSVWAMRKKEADKIKADHLRVKSEIMG
jgi:hypothetical protein